MRLDLTPFVLCDPICSGLTDKQQAFIDFVLGQCVQQGVEELDQDKLSPFLRLRYNAFEDAFAELGRPDQVRALFVGFQRHLYERRPGVN